MRTFLLIWIPLLFAIAVGLALLNIDTYALVTIETQLREYRLTLNTLIIANIAFTVALYALIRLLSGIVHIPARIRAAKVRKSRRALSFSALSFLEGKYTKSLKLAQKSLANEGSSRNKILALTLSAISAEHNKQTNKRDECLAQMATLPHNLQLPRFLFEAELYLKANQITHAREAIDQALHLEKKLTKALELDLMISIHEQNPEKILTLTQKLLQEGVLDKARALQYQLSAYELQLAQLTTEKEIKRWAKNIDNTIIQEYLSDQVASKYARLDLNEAAVDWIITYYPINLQPNLLDVLARSTIKLEAKKQQKVLEQGETWLNSNKDNAKLLLCMGKIASANQLWGKAQGYLEASLSLQPSFDGYFTLARLFTETDKIDQAKEQTKKAMLFAEKLSDLDNQAF